MAYNFKSEEEVQQYLENIGTEYRFSCFKEKKSEVISEKTFLPFIISSSKEKLAFCFLTEVAAFIESNFASCHLLGDYLESVTKDFEAAAKIYKSNCDERKYAKSCLKYGNYSFLGKGCEEDYMTALQYYKKACDLGSADGCLHTGVMLTSTNKDKKQVIKKDYVEGLKFLETACSKGNAIACYFASGIYITGADGVPQNKIKASELSLHACNGGNIYACMNLSQMYKEGDGVEKDESKSKLYKDKAREIRDDQKKRHSIGLQQYS